MIFKASLLVNLSLAYEKVVHKRMLVLNFKFPVVAVCSSFFSAKKNEVYTLRMLLGLKKSPEKSWEISIHLRMNVPVLLL